MWASLVSVLLYCSVYNGELFRRFLETTGQQKGRKSLGLKLKDIACVNVFPELWDYMPIPRKLDLPSQTPRVRCEPKEYIEVPM